MQNKAQWLETTPAGFKVRIGFTPMNAAEAVRTKALLENCTVTIAGVSSNGQMSIDLVFTPKLAVKTSPKESPKETPKVPAPKPEEAKKETVQ